MHSYAHGWVYNKNDLGTLKSLEKAYASVNKNNQLTYSLQLLLSEK